MTYKKILYLSVIFLATRAHADEMQMWFDVYTLKKLSENVIFYMEQEIEFANNFKQYLLYYIDPQLLLRQNKILQWGVGCRFNIKNPPLTETTVSYNPYFFLQPKFIMFKKAALTYQGRFGIHFGKQSDTYGFWLSTLLLEYPDQGRLSMFFQQDFTFNQYNTKNFDSVESYIGTTVKVTQRLSLLAYYTIEFDKTATNTPWAMTKAVTFGFNLIF